MFYTIGEYFCKKFFDIRKLRKFRSTTICFMLELSQIINSIVPVVNLSNIHKWWKNPPLKLSFSKVSLAVIDKVKEWALFLTGHRFNNFQVFQTLWIEDHVLVVFIKWFRLISNKLASFDCFVANQGIFKEWNHQSEWFQCQILIFMTKFL